MDDFVKLILCLLIFVICMAIYACCCYKGTNGEPEYYDRHALIMEIENPEQQEAVARLNVIMNGVIEKRVIEGTRGSDNNKSNIHLEGASSNKSSRQSILQNISSFFSSDKSSLNTSDKAFESSKVMNALPSTNMDIDAQLPEEPNGDSYLDNTNDTIDKKGDITEGTGRAKRQSLGDSFVRLRMTISTSIQSSISRSSKEIVEYTPDKCFICLERYKVGDRIYWSKNDKCSHSFHSQCMMGWLFKHDDCPLCRENYVTE